MTLEGYVKWLRSVAAGLRGFPQLHRTAFPDCRIEREEREVEYPRRRYDDSVAGSP